MDRTMVEGQAKTLKRVRFRVASGNSGRVLKEMFKDEGPCDSLDSDCTSSSATSGDGAPYSGYLGSELDDSESEPDELLVYAAGAAKDRTFTSKRVNILSKNGTVRGVKHKVSAGQTLFENLSHCNSVSLAYYHHAWGNEKNGPVSFKLQVFISRTFGIAYIFL